MPTTTTEPPPPLFTAPERDLIRRSLCMQFSQYPSAAEGILLRTWRGGPCAGEPKLPPAMRTMVERGLMELRMDGRGLALTSPKRVGLPCVTSRKTGACWIPCSSGMCARNSGLRVTWTLVAKTGRSLPADIVRSPAPGEKSETPPRPGSSRLFQSFFLALRGARRIAAAMADD